MHLNQAKAAAGIAPDEAIAGRASLEQAIRHCVKGIVAARRNGSDNLAAELSAAKEVFRRRLHRNTCSVCGVTIGRGATHCQLHKAGRAVKALPAAPGWKAKEQNKGNGNARVDVSPKGGLIARFGFYAKPIQKVFKKWRATIGEARAQRCFVEVASGLIFGGHRISLARLPRAQWQCALEFGAALAGFMADRTTAQSWLLNHMHRFQVADGETGFASWEQISAGTGGNGWPKFSARILSKAADDLELPTPKDKAAPYRRAVAPK